MRYSVWRCNHFLVKHLDKHLFFLVLDGDSLCELFASSDFSVEDIVSLIDNVAMQLTNGFHDRTLQINVISMCSHLKLYANQLEAIYKGKESFGLKTYF